MEKESARLVHAARNYIQKHKMIEEGQSILVAVSGGPDSSALLFVLAQLRGELGFSLYAAYFDHQLRPQSAAEGDLAASLAESLSVPFYRGAAPVADLAGDQNLEDYARRLRYRFLRQVAKMVGATRIATAHHAADQAETLLLHLFRGSGLEGLAAIAPQERDLIRPFLQVQKKDILNLLQAEGIPYAQDESNLSMQYMRNRIRLDIMPRLQALNPRLQESLLAAAEICRAENELLSQATVGALEDCRLPSEGLRGAMLARLPLALQRRVLRLAYEEYAMPRGLFAGALGYGHTEAILALAEGAMVALPRGAWAYRAGGDILFAKNKPAMPGICEKRNFLQPLRLGKGEIGDFHYQAEVVSAEQAREICEKGLGRWEILLPIGWLSQLAFRFRREGDAIAAAGMEGHKKLKKLFAEAKIPAAQRASWPLLVRGEEILWLCGLRKRALPPFGEKAVWLCLQPGNSLDNVHQNML